MHTNTLHVLLADSSALVGDRLERLICRVPGVTTCTRVNSYQDLHKRLDSGTFNAVLIDLMLPGGCLLDELPPLACAPACSVIVLGPDDSPSLRERCLAAGATHYFAKGSGYLDVLALIGRQADGSA